MSGSDDTERLLTQLLGRWETVEIERRDTGDRESRVVVRNYRSDDDSMLGGGNRAEYEGATVVEALRTAVDETG